MKCWLIKNFWLVSLGLSFLLFWFFGDVIVFLTLFAVIAFFIALKGLFKISLFYIEIIVFVIYLLFALIGILFIGAESVKILILVLGFWFIGSFFVNGRLK